MLESSILGICCYPLRIHPVIGVTTQTYDPGYDLNQDGEIDIFDVVEIAGWYGSSARAIDHIFEYSL